MRLAVAVGLPVVWSNAVLPALGLNVRGRTTANAVFATAYALALGGRPRWMSRRGLGAGAVAAGVVVGGYGAALAIPRVRRHLAELADRGPDVSAAEWTAVHIPIGTVYAEELVFRATLTPLLRERLGRPGKWLGALTFGLVHVRPARSAGDPVAATVGVTALAGVVLDHLYERTGSALAPALLHTAINAGGAALPIVARLLTPPVHSDSTPVEPPADADTTRAGEDDLLP
ncbi:CPBP family intramembrane glutamic endopeptidase [Nocardia sp. NPDC003693]